MVLFPAIDILSGKAVRLYKGDYNAVTVYSERPWEFAEDFREKGCSAIHIVDLDGARSGETVNMDTVKRIASVEGLYSEIGGGIRNMETVSRYLEAGVDRVILGTAALNDPSFLKNALREYGNRIAVGVDLKDGKVAVKGWLETSDKEGIQFLKELEDLGVEGVIVTDISRDGAMKGANRELYRELSSKFAIDLIASGGVSSMEDVTALAEMKLHGAIIGKAYYIGAVDLKQAVEAAK